MHISLVCHVGSRVHLAIESASKMWPCYCVWLKVDQAECFEILLDDLSYLVFSDKFSSSHMN
jgi:hypothetical protein